jgi:hypothetical protein
LFSDPNSLPLPLSPLSVYQDVPLEVAVEASGPDGDVRLPVVLNRGTGDHASVVQSLATKATLNDLEDEGKRDEVRLYL